MSFKREEADKSSKTCSNLSEGQDRPTWKCAVCKRERLGVYNAWALLSSILSIKILEELWDYGY